VFAQLKIAITEAIQPNFDELSKILWQAHGHGYLTDDEAQNLAEGIELRRKLQFMPRRRSIFPASRPKVRIAKRAERIGRRRRLAAYAPIGPRIAAQFSVSELAVLTVLANEVRRAGKLVWPISRVAAAAGVCRAMVQMAFRKARELGLISVKHERPRGQRNRFNEVKIVCSEWLSWLKGRGGSKNVAPMNKQDLSTKAAATANPCIARESNPYQPAWKRLISRTSPGPLNTQSPPQRCSSVEAMNLLPDLADLIR
jgi:hypothetical protein